MALVVVDKAGTGTFLRDGLQELVGGVAAVGDVNDRGVGSLVEVGDLAIEIVVGGKGWGTGPGLAAPSFGLNKRRAASEGLGRRQRED